MKDRSQYSKSLSDRHAERLAQKRKYDRQHSGLTRYADRDNKFTVPNSKEKFTLTEREKQLMCLWMATPGTYPIKRPERVDPTLWKGLTGTQRVHVAFHEWVHEQMLAGRL